MVLKKRISRGYEQYFPALIKMNTMPHLASNTHA